MSELHNAARYYADDRNWKIFPLRPGEKVPLTLHGVKDATTDAAQIDAWWTLWPNANIGFACGCEYGIHVIDVDVDIEKGIDGWKTITDLCAAGHTFPETIWQKTPRGGMHYFYQSNVKPKNKNSFMHGVDIRSEGYYVLLSPSVHPNGGKYEWKAGMTPWEHGLAEYPDFMRPVIETPQVAPIWLPHRISKPADSEIIARAKAYLATCEPAIQGFGGHDKLFWAAAAMVQGFQLSDDIALDLLEREYNPRCMPPWDLSNPAEAKDFRRKVSEAHRVPLKKSAGWLLNDPAYVIPDNCITPEFEQSVKQLLHRDTTIFISHEKNQKDELRFLCQPTGLLGEICAWINKTSLRPQPLFTLACSIAFCGALFGQKVRDRLNTRTNIYCMAVGKSSSGKNHAPKQIREICFEAGCLNLIGGDDVASDSAIEKTLSEHPATLYLWDEIGHMIKSMKHNSNNHKAGVVTLLMKLYSSAGNVYKGKEYATQEQRTICQPCCCLYGTSTPDRFAEGIDPVELSDGWLGRCLVFQANDRPKKDRDHVAEPVPQSIVETVAAWCNRKLRPERATGISDIVKATPSGEYYQKPPEQIEIPVDCDAEQLFIAFDEEAAEVGKKDPIMDCLWAKAEENARKIAIIVAASENYNEPRITLSIADYSMRLIRYLLSNFADSVVPKITSSKTEKEKRRIIEVIANSGIEGITKSDITRKTQWIYAYQRNPYIADLVADEIIVESMSGNKGLRYWTKDNYNAYVIRQQQKA